MNQPIDTVSVEVVSDFGQLERAIANLARTAGSDIESAISDGVAGAESALNDLDGDQLSDLDSAATSAGDALGDGIGSGADEAQSALDGIEPVSLDELDALADSAGDAIGSGISSGADEAQSAIDSISGGGLDGLASEADTAGDAIGSEIDEGADQAEDALDDVGTAGESMKGLLVGAAGVIAGAFAAIQIGGFIKDATLEAQALNSAIANTESIIESTENAAGLTADQIRDLSQELSLTIGVDSLEVQEASNILLTFKEVSSDVFDRAIALGADMGAVFGTDLSGAATQLGKALNDPVQGISALSRVGVSFTEEQKEQIETLQESGDILGAQTIILDELEGQVGGTAEASADSTAKIANAFTELQRVLGGPIIAALDEITPALIGVIDTLEPVFGAIGEVLGELLTQIVPIVEVLGAALSEGLQALLPAIEPLGEAALAIVEAFAPILPLIGQLIGTLLPPLAQMFTVVANAIAPLIDVAVQFITDALEQMEPLFPPIVDLVSELAGVFGGALASVLPILIDLWMTLFDAVSPLIPTVLELIRALLPLLDPIIALVQALLPPLVMLFETLITPLVALLDPILQLATMIISTLVEAGLVPLIEILASLLVPVLELLTSVLEVTLVPAMEFVAELLEGDFSAAFSGAGDLIGSVGGFIMDIIGAVKDFIQARIDDIVNAAGRVGEFVSAITGFFTEARDAVGEKIEEALQFVIDLPGNILDALGDLGSLLFDSGQEIIQGLIDGINNMIDNLGDTMSNVASSVTDYLPFSPAKLGPLSGSGSPDRSGESIGRMLAEGLESETDDIGRATSNFMSELRNTIRAESADLAPSDIVADTARPVTDQGDPFGVGIGGRRFNIENLNMNVVDRDLPFNELMRNLEMIGAR